jgi:hypothetical protein
LTVKGHPELVRRVEKRAEVTPEQVEHVMWEYNLCRENAGDYIKKILATNMNA